MSKPLTILVLTTSFPSKKTERKRLGGGKFVLEDVKVFQTAGYNITVLAPIREGLDKFEVIDSIKVRRFPFPFQQYSSLYKNLPVHKNLGLLNFVALVFMSMKYFIEIIKETQKLKPNLVWANWVQVAFIARLSLFCTSYRSKLLFTIRGSDVRNFPNWLNKIIFFFTKNLFNVYPGDPEVVEWVDQYKLNEIRVPRTYIDTNIKRNIDFTRPFNLLIISRFDEQEELYRMQGIGRKLIDIVLAVVNRHENIEITFIGDGVALENYKTLCEGHDNVSFTGWLTKFDHYLTKADIVLGGAGLSGVAMDAAPYGIPLLISKYYSKPLWKDKVNSLVYDPYDFEQFIATIDFAINNRSFLVELGKKAKEDLKEYALRTENAAEIWSQKVNDYVYDIV